MKSRPEGLDDLNNGVCFVACGFSAAMKSRPEGLDDPMPATPIPTRLGPQ